MKESKQAGWSVLCLCSPVCLSAVQEQDMTCSTRLSQFGFSIWRTEEKQSSVKEHKQVTYPSHPQGTLLLMVRCSCPGLKKEKKKKKKQDKIGLYTNPWKGLVKIQAWRLMELHYNQIGGRGSMPCRRDPDVSALVLRLKIFARGGNKVVCAP